LAQRDLVVDVLRALDLPMITGINVEVALDYPGQQLAVDLYARDPDDLSMAVGIVRAMLAERGVPARTAAEIDAEILLTAAAA